MEKYTLENLIPVLIFIVPGFVSYKIWTILIPTENKKLSDQIIEILCYSAINFAVLFPLFFIVSKNNNYCIIIPLLILIFLVFPIIWPILISKILKSGFMKGRVINPTPKAWDHYFSSGQPCFMLIHLKNGNKIGGLYANNSFASSFPNPEDLYISEVWKIDEEGKFIEKIENSKGLLISKDFIDFIEMYDIN